MTLLFRDDAYLKEADAVVVGSDETGLWLDRTLFYPNGGGQPGDTGTITWDGGSIVVTDTRKRIPLAESGPDILHVVAPGSALPAVGTPVHLSLDWERRFNHMRLHTALHLLCAVVPAAVTGGQVAADRARLDFDIPGEGLDKERIESRMNELIAADHPVRDRTISDEELAQRPELVRTMSVQPPTGSGSVRLLQIGTDDATVDLQPCGGTHVARTGEIGRISVIKIENKGKQNRRVILAFAE